MKAIKIKYLSVTATQGVRMQASIKDGRGTIKTMTEPREYALDNELQARQLAKRFMKKLNWNNKISGIGVYADDYYVTIK